MNNRNTCEKPASKFIRASLWAASSSYFFSGINYLGQIFLARLLIPDLYGQYAFCVAIIDMISFIATFCSTAGYINGEDTQTAFNACFILTSIMSSIFILIALTVHYGLSSYYSEIASLFLALCFAQIFRLFGNLYLAPLEKKLQYKTTAIIRGLVSSASLMLIVTIALFKQSVWLLILRDSTQFMLLFILGYFYSIKRFDLSFKKTNLLSQLSFAKKTLTPRFFEACFFRFPEILLQYLFGATVVGNFYQARYLAYLPNKLSEPFTHQVLFAYLSKYKTNLNKLGHQVTWLNYVLVRTLLPITILIYLYGTKLFTLCYGQHWHLAAWYFPQFSLFVLFTPLYISLLITSYSISKQKYATFGYLLAFLTFATGILIQSSYHFVPLVFSSGLLVAYFYIAFKLKNDDIYINLRMIFLKPTLIILFILFLNRLFMTTWVSALSFFILFILMCCFEREHFKVIKTALKLAVSKKEFHYESKS